MSWNNGENSCSALLSVRNIVKSFSKNDVLKDVSFAINRGDVLALVGGNGAGKSTLMKIIMGYYKPDSGKIILNGEELKGGSPAISLESGIYMVPQEPLLFPNMTVEENICIGFDCGKVLLRQKLNDVMKKFSWELDLQRKANQLSIAEQQILELLRGILREAKVLILDEPSSALTFDEVQSLYACVRELQAQGKGIIYITHRLTEVFELASDVAILNDGCITLSGPIENFTKDMLLDSLIPTSSCRDGQATKVSVSADVVVDQAKGEDLAANEQKVPVFELIDFSGYGFKDVNLSIYPGEILGLAGVVGAGRTELARTIFGQAPVLSGKVVLNGQEITGCSTAKVIKSGLYYVPEDRHLHGLFKMLSVPENTCAALLNFRSGSHKKLLIDSKAEECVCREFIDKLSVKVSGLEQEIGSLSGGNQQKILIARSLSINPKVIILDEPTRGIDAASRGDVYRLIRGLKQQGVAILLISSDLEEVVELSDRALSLYRGRINAEFKSAEIEADGLMRAAFGFSNKE